MAKVIFVLQRRADLTREQCLAHWSGEQHLAIAGKLPGLTRWVQNHVSGGPTDPVCDGIGELWFASSELMNAALSSPEMAAAVEDAKRFLDMERTGMILVEEKTLIELSELMSTNGGYSRVTGMPGDHAEGRLAPLFGLAGLASWTPPAYRPVLARRVGQRRQPFTHAEGPSAHMRRPRPTSSAAPHERRRQKLAPPFQVSATAWAVNSRAPESLGSTTTSRFTRMPDTPSSGSPG
jgi:uncharacterized protein (TIGR02118 family)